LAVHISQSQAKKIPIKKTLHILSILFNGRLGNQKCYKFPMSSNSKPLVHILFSDFTQKRFAWAATLTFEKPLCGKE